ncbi:GNAT family N-acetyltransferase [Clostridium senegalense]|uniref:GNAT family N-acetyltransferase n=1 Tax=Clostridium senegalense TaxID=1465809 RepID=UPI001C1041C6|nr:GNAT family N-acetyltransferase [Clostridium senegalense]MBU5225064.1 GNAT family N-acetyltransferase [Clostridium senegalense]
MVKINTKRLCILPLDENNLKLAINNFNDMEMNLGFNITKRAIDEREKRVYQIRLNDVVSNPNNYIWHTIWVISLKEENRIIGTIMIKGYPNDNGEVIVGYAIEKAYRCKGYMTEVLNCLIKWILKNDDVKFVVADTVKTNIASQKVLKKVGMNFYKEDDECFWWRIEKSDIVSNLYL